MRNMAAHKFVLSAKIALCLKKSKKGQTLVEYALILSFVSVIAVTVMISLSNQVATAFTTIDNQLSMAEASH